MDLESWLFSSVQKALAYSLSLSRLKALSPLLWCHYFFSSSYLSSNSSLESLWLVLILHKHGSYKVLLGFLTILDKCWWTVINTQLKWRLTEQDSVAWRQNILNALRYLQSLKVPFFYLLLWEVQVVPCIFCPISHCCLWNNLQTPQMMLNGCMCAARGEESYIQQGNLYQSQWVWH